MTIVFEAGRSGQLLSKAVHRNSSFSIDGILERVFTKAFSGLVYPQIWEDPAVDLAAMAIEPHHHIVTIASGGCNALSYLTAGPARVTAVDLNHTHVALTRLKLAGLRHLPNWNNFYGFFGAANQVENLHLYDFYLQQHLDGETRTYWERRNWRGVKRLNQFKTNFYTKGLLGRFIGFGHLIAKIYGHNPAALAHCTSLQEQRDAYEREIAPLFQKRAVKWLTKQRASLFGLGIPPAQYDALAGQEKMIDVLQQRLKKLACGFPMAENYFAWQAFNRGYAPTRQGPLPPYLMEQNFDTLRSATEKLNVLQGSVTSLLQAAPRASVDRMVLLDAQDWMTDAQLNDLWKAISHAAAPKARVIFRTAGVETILPGRVEAATLGQWSYLEAQSLELGQQDRSSIYGGFHIYEFNN